jgi:hypothetical protein
MLDRTAIDSEKASIYDQLGMAKYNQEDYKEIIRSYEKVNWYLSENSSSRYILFFLIDEMDYFNE